MKIYFDENTSLDWNINGYEFPEMDQTLSKQDANLLYGGMDVKTENTTWHMAGSFLFTYEIQNIIEWFENIDKNLLENKEELKFSESELVFRQKECSKDKYRIQFDFTHPGNPETLQESDTLLTGDFSKEEIKEIIDFLNKTLNEYPVRVEE
jgi:uncharacterized protein YktA (UPF0223 family)